MVLTSALGILMAVGVLIAVWDALTRPPYLRPDVALSPAEEADENVAVLLDELQRLVEAGRMSEADALIDTAQQQPLSARQAIRLLRPAVIIRLQMGDHDRALRDCLRLTELAPDDPQSWRLLLTVFEDGGYDAARTIEPLQRLADSDDADAADFRIQLVDALVAAGDRDSARKHFDDLAANDPGYIAHHRLTHARLLALEGHYEEAFDLLQQIDESHDQFPESLLLRGRWSLQLQRIDDADAVLNRLLQLDPFHPEAHFLMGQVAANQGDLQQAQVHWDKQQRLREVRRRIPELEQRLAQFPMLP